MSEPAAKRLKRSHPHVPTPFQLTDPSMRLAYAKTALYHVSDDVLELILRYTRPPITMRRQMDAVITEYRSVLKNVASVRYHPSLPWHQQRRHIRTAAGQILFRTQRVPWERARFGYSRDIQYLRRQVASRRLRAAERLVLKSVIDRLWRRYLERLDTIYDTC
jgi:preprotein translocase subunit SecA